MTNEGTNVDDGASPTRGSSIRHGTIMGYLLALVGLMFVINAGLSALADGLTLQTASGLAAGLFVVGGGVYVHFEPNEKLNMDRPAPRSLYVVAVIATVAFVFWVVMRYTSG